MAISQLQTEQLLLQELERLLMVRVHRIWAYGDSPSATSPAITSLNASTVVVNKSSGTLSLSFPNTTFTTLLPPTFFQQLAHSHLLPEHLTMEEVP